NLLQKYDQKIGSNWTEKIYQSIANSIDKRSQDYIRKHAEIDVQIGSVLFARDRSIIIISHQGKIIINNQ
ncbi:MAG TPA: cobalt-precorrin-5B (C(1))-methyltransferase, partial [Cyanothece sp. UBA12306]|nr:cobalt-precorrin-5B (C(1))-methyltransferase [Cyanothece sp. UBA12306]